MKQRQMKIILCTLSSVMFSISQTRHGEIQTVGQIEEFYLDERT